MPKNKNVTIKYTSREFESIKDDLVDHAKRFYPDNYRDFTTPSFGSMVMDSVAYVGDILSYYLDYNVNESFLDTAIEFDNVRKHARSMGYRFKGTPSSYGIISLFIMVPANSDGNAPDENYIPILKKGSTFKNSSAGNFILTEDVNFSDPKWSVMGARQNPLNGANTYYAIKAYGQIQSGAFQEKIFDLVNSPFERFRKVRVGGSNVSEVYSVVDSEGNIYYEVDNLSQEVIFMETTNKNALNDGVRSILKPFVTTRKYTVYQDDTGTYIQFGFGAEDDDSSGLTDPSKVALKMHGKKTISNTSFDPNQLLSTNKLGISPYNTKLRVINRINVFSEVTSPANSIQVVSDKEFYFENQGDLNTTETDFIIGSLECNNEFPINGIKSDISTEELKERAKAYYAAQNRAVTKNDYESLVYQMPAKFGTIKRANIVNDPSSSNRKITLYVVSENDAGNLGHTSQVTKNNIKNWLNHYIPINDSVEIKDAIIVNFTVDFTVMYDRNYDPDSVIFACMEKLKTYFNETLYIGEPLYLTKIYNTLNRVTGVADVKNVIVENKTDSGYSPTVLEMEDAMSKDGTYIKVPKNVILELKYPNSDIKGTVR